MRLVLVALALGAILVGGPRSEVDRSVGTFPNWVAPERIESTVLAVATRHDRVAVGSDGLNTLALEDRVAAVALAFAPRLTLDSMPILPDIPERAVAPWRDDPVQASPAPDPLNPPKNTRPVKILKETKLLTVTEPERTAGKFLRPPRSDAQITGNRLALRTGPAKRFASIGSLFAGDKVRITGERQGGYLPVVAEDGQSGWVFHSYVRKMN